MTTQQNTTNKSDRELGNKFDLGQFNTRFEDNDKTIDKENNLKKSPDMKLYDDIIYNKLPHKKPVEDILINIRELFYNLIEILLDRKNPIPYIFSSPDRHFAFSIFLIIVGTLLLLFSNLMISYPNDK